MLIGPHAPGPHATGTQHNRRSARGQYPHLCAKRDGRCISSVKARRDKAIERARPSTVVSDHARARATAPARRSRHLIRIRAAVQTAAWRCRIHGDDCSAPNPHPTPLPAGEGLSCRTSTRSRSHHAGAPVACRYRRQRAFLYVAPGDIVLRCLPSAVTMRRKLPCCPAAILA